MRPTTLFQTSNLVKRAVKNYPTVCSDIGKEVLNQMVKTFYTVVDLLRLFAKAGMILLFPFWIIPFALAFFLIIRLIENQTIQINV
ncbi:hypothetical protein [Acinetobacter sp. A47]|uniref:hypothetical protein n=1 Tax=Acinetobacter sp. A47 TaxID=1561217 RepID=UPI00056E88FA|nr:hypothetical protein [Acinetobacter sp. A47]